MPNYSFLFEIVTQPPLVVVIIQSKPSGIIQWSQKAKHILLCLTLNSNHGCFPVLISEMGSHENSVESFV